MWTFNNVSDLRFRIAKAVHRTHSYYFVSAAQTNVTGKNITRLFFCPFLRCGNHFHTVQGRSRLLSNTVADKASAVKNKPFLIEKVNREKVTRIVINFFSMTLFVENDSSRQVRCNLFPDGLLY